MEDRATGEQRPIARHLRNRSERRNNAPLRPRPPATTVPDFLIALAIAGWTMAVVFFVASFADSNVTSGDAGPWLARLFAGALFVAGLFLALLAFALLRDDRYEADHYVTPALLGLVIGGAEAWLFLWPAEDFLFAPFILLVFAFRPLRHWIVRLFNRAQGTAG